MTQVLIIEDEPQAAHRLENLIGEIDSDLKVLAKLDSVKQCIKWLTENQLPSLIFLDIQLGDGISFDFLQSSRRCRTH